MSFSYLRRSLGVRLIRSANETADVTLARHPFGMTIAKNYIRSIRSVIINGVGEILWSICGAGRKMFLLRRRIGLGCERRYEGQERR